MATYTIETYRDRKGEHRWRLRHRNGRVVAEGGEGYRRRADALRALTRLLDAPPAAFRLHSIGKEVIAVKGKKKGGGKGK